MAQRAKVKRGVEKSMSRFLFPPRALLIGTLPQAKEAILGAG